MKVLVTGGAGFVGTNLCQELALRNHQISIIDNLRTGLIENLADIPCDFIQADIMDCNPSCFDEKQLVIHAAAIPACNSSHFFPVADAQDNYLVGLKVLENIIAANVQKVILISSASVYGNADFPWTESSIPLPRDPYGHHKLMLEQMFQMYAKIHGFKLMIIRPQHLFGKFQRPDLIYRNVVSKWIQYSISGHPLPVYGSVSLSRAFTPISLFSRAVCELIERDQWNSSLWNIGTSKVRSLKEVITSIQARFDHPIQIALKPAPPALLNLAVASTTKQMETLHIDEDSFEWENCLAELHHWIMSRPWTESCPVIPSTEAAKFQAIYEGMPTPTQALSKNASS